jgi:hypothetical protein
MQAAYTWDKNLSDVFFGNAANINSALDVKSQYGRVSYDRPQRLVVNYSYDLPFGKGMSGFANKVIGGWNVSGITIAQSGDPLTFIAPGVTGTAFGTSNTGILQGVSTAQFCEGMGNKDVLAPGSIVSRVRSGNYFNTAAFGTFQDIAGVNTYVPCPSAPANQYSDNTATAYGNTRVGIVLGPGQFNWDISILKNTSITERVKMQFRADFYNAFNHAQFADPGGTQFSAVGFENVTTTQTLFDAEGNPTDVIPTYGAILNTNVNPRLIQFGLRFTF